MTPAQQAIIIRDTVAGKTQQAIGCTLGVSHQAISKQQKMLRTRIDQEIDQLIQRGLAPSRRTLCRLAAEGNKSTDAKMLKLSLEAAKYIFSVAVPPSSVNNLIQINNNTSIPDVVAALLEQVTKNDKSERNLIIIDQEG